jgi:hypothetical protein
LALAHHLGQGSFGAELDPAVVFLMVQRCTGSRAISWVRSCDEKQLAEIRRALFHVARQPEILADEWQGEGER